MPRTVPNPEPRSARPSRSQARRVNAERKLRVFNLLKAGVPIAEIALQEGLTARRVREMIQATLE